MRIKKIIFAILIGLIIFMAGFGVSSGRFQDILNRYSSEVRSIITYQHERAEIYPAAWLYNLLSEEDYVRLYEGKLSGRMALIAISNALFNFIFQPVFFCVFTPQSILYCVLFPFFLYGSIKYFSKVPIMILGFVFLAINIGMKDVYVESLLRHRMSCELIYLLIGTAGFTAWITKKSS